MASLADFFERLLDRKAEYLRAKEGKEFENRITSDLIRYAMFAQVEKDQVINDSSKAVFQKCKAAVLAKAETNHVANPFGYRQHFMFQPYGTQQYPDYLILDGDALHSIEVKYSAKDGRKPMWNSGPPRPNGIYIFGSYNKGDLTYFVGRDVIDPELARLMHDWDEVRQVVTNFNRRHMATQEYGFNLYARKAFDQNKVTNPDAVTDFLSNPKRSQLENEVISHLRSFR